MHLKLLIAPHIHMHRCSTCVLGPSFPHQFPYGSVICSVICGLLKCLQWPLAIHGLDSCLLWLQGFIKKFVQCYSCGNPETTIKIRKELLHLKCKVCVRVCVCVCVRERART